VVAHALQKELESAEVALSGEDEKGSISGCPLRDEGRRVGEQGTQLAVNRQ